MQRVALILFAAALAPACAQKTDVAARLERFDAIAPLLTSNARFECGAACAVTSDVSGVATLGAKVSARYAEGFTLTPPTLPGCSVKVVPLSAASTRPTARGGLLTFENVRPGQHALFVARHDELEELLLFDAQASEVRYRLEKGPDTASVAVTATGALELHDAEGRACIRAQRPFLVDAAGTRRDAEFVVEGDALAVRWNADGLVAPFVLDPVWQTTGKLPQQIGDTAFALLPNGDVLMSGGSIPSGPSLATVFLYDSNTGTWSTPAQTMTTGRKAHSLRTLPNGQLLATGGFIGSGSSRTAGAETYNPATGVWTAVTSNMGTTRAGHLGIVLDDGGMLLVSGDQATDQLDFYDYQSRSFADAGRTSVARNGAGAAKLLDGRVIIVSGQASGSTFLTSTEIYDPFTRATSNAGTLTTGGRKFPGVTVMADGGVVMYGGATGTIILSPQNSSERWSSGTWASAGTMGTGRFAHGGARLPDNTLLVMGGLNSTPQKTTERYDPAAGTWAAAAQNASMDAGHIGFGVTTMATGRVILGGGATGNGTVYTDTVELFDSTTPSFTVTSSTLATSRQNATATLLPNGKVLVAGGSTLPGSTALATAALYDPTNGTFTALTGANSTLSNARELATATLLPNGRVLIAGGMSGGVPIDTSELFDPTTNQFSTLRNMQHGRERATATLLPNGKVLVAGGCEGSTCPANAELYDPTFNTWTLISAPMSQPRYGHMAVLLRNGKVLLFGGADKSGFPPAFSSGELYDSTTNQFTNSAGTMATGRQFSTAALLGDGRVLAAGGYNGTYLTSAELYNPTTDSWSTLPATLNGAHHSPVWTMLRDGRVLIAQGLSANNVINTGAEVYDPLIGKFTPYGTSSARYRAPAVPLLDGKLLLVGGNNAGASLDTGEVFDTGPVAAALRPNPAFPATFTPGQTVTLSGTNLRGVGEGGTGGFQEHTPADFPIVRITRVDSGDTRYLPTRSWGPNRLTFDFPAGYPSGHVRASVVAAGVSSNESLVLVPAAPSGPTAIALEFGIFDPTSGLVGECVGPFTITGVDGADGPAPVANDTVVNLTSTETGTFYSDAACGTAITSVFIAAGDTSAPGFWYRGTTAATHQLGAFAAGFSSTPIRNVILSGSGGTTAVAFEVTAYPSPTASGTSAPVTIRAMDSGDFTVTNFAGTVVITSTDSAATLPVDVVFNGTEGGIKTSGNITLRTAGTQTITATSGSLTGNQTVTVNGGTVSSFTVTGFGASVAAGSSAPLTVTAKDSTGNTVTNFTGTVSFTSTDAAATLPANLVFTAADLGVKTSSAATLRTAGTRAFTATSGSITGSHAPITVTADNASALLVTGFPASVVAGTSAPLTIRAVDSFGNTATGFTGSVTFTSTDPAAVLPPPLVFAGADQGQKVSGAAELRTAGVRTLTASAGATVVGTHASITVTHDGATALNVSGFGSSVPAGSSAPLTVSVRDAYGNAVLNYAGTISFTSNDAAATVPVNLVFNGTQSGVMTSGNATLRTAGTRWFTATAVGTSSLTGSHPDITVTASAAANLTLGGVPSSVTAGAAVTVTIILTDSFGNPATGYAGTVTLTSSDGQAVLPAAHTFSSSDNGTASFPVTFRTAGSQTLTASDGTLSANASTTVLAGSATRLVVSGVPSPVDSGARADVTVEARDDFGNRATTYAGTVQWTSTDTGAQLPAPATFGSSDNGLKTLTQAVRFFTAGTHSLTATDTAAPSITGSQLGIVVNPGGAPWLLDDANRKAALNVPYPYNVFGRISASGALPMTFDRCAGPQGFSVDSATGAVSWTPDVAGSVSLCVKATNALGEDLLNFTVNVIDRAATPVTAVITATPSTGVVPLNVAFDSVGSSADPSAMPMMFAWDFGDGSPTATGATTTHLYTKAGSYRAELTALDAYGAKATASETIRVSTTTGLVPPTARIVGSAFSGQGSLTASFTCDCQVGSAPIVAKQWSVTDGKSALGDTLSHTFSAGRHEVTLTVIDANGLTGVDQREVVVSDLAARTPPECRAGVSPAAAQVPFTATWSATASSPVGIASQRWIFDAADVVAWSTAQRSYDTAGRTTAVFEATDGNGLVCRKEVTLTRLTAGAGVPPRIIGTPPTAARCGEALRYEPAVEGDAPFTWSVSGGGAVDERSGAFSWTPVRIDSGAREIVLTVDSASGRDEQRFTVEVSCERGVPLTVGCGCTSAGAAPAVLLLMAFALRRRRLH